MLAVDGGVGAYEMDVASFRPYLETQERGTRQVLFLDFDGETISANDLFGVGAEVAPLSPLVDFLGNWGLTQADEDAVIDSIVATVRENFAEVGLQGNNGDRATDGIDGHFQLDVLTSRDFVDAQGFPYDPFGEAHVSRVIVGGTIEELGRRTIGVAESIDPGNFSTGDTAVVLLDLLSGPATDVNSLNQFPLAAGTSIIDLDRCGGGQYRDPRGGPFYRQLAHQSVQQRS